MNILAKIVLLMCLAPASYAEIAHIFCHYEYKGIIPGKPAFLAFDQDQDMKVDARFDQRLQSYVLSLEDYARAKRNCLVQCQKMGLRFKEVKAASPTGKWGHDLRLMHITFHHPVIFDGTPQTLSHVETARKTLLARFPWNTAWESNLFADDSTNHLASLVARLPTDADAPMEEFVIDRPTISDFLRQDIKVVSDEMTLFHKCKGEYYLPTQVKIADASDLGIRRLVAEFFATMESAIPSEIKERVGRAAIRSRIALALATRTQTFEATVTVDLTRRAQLLDAALSFPDRQTGMKHKITVKGAKIQLETIRIYDPAYWDSEGLISLDLPIQSTRTAELDLETGHLSLERIQYEMA